MIGIYKITFANDHYYIGQAVDTNRRFSQHKRELKKGVHTNSRLQNCYNKYGVPVFEVIEECVKEDLNSIESKYLYDNVDNDLCCNFCKEGRSQSGMKRSDESKKKISDYQRLVGKVKPVYMFTRDNMHMVARYNSITDAAKDIQCGPKDIQKSCRSNGKYNVKGYKFMFAQPIDNLLSEISRIVKI